MLWRSLKTGFFASMLVLLAGCSGVSIGALDSRVEADISSVAVIDTGGRAGQLYNRELRRALYVNGEASPAYDLTSKISVSSSSTLSVRGVTSTFKKMTMTAVFTLKNQDDGEVLLSDRVTADATLGTVSSLFGQDQSEAHARDRMAKLLAQRVVQQLQLYFLKNLDA
jgi:LPS-assembly lipoprotein